MSRIAVVPGSFDPITLGHLDVIERAANIFDEIHVVVVHNPGKAAMLPIAQRVSLIEQAVADRALPDTIRVTGWSVGLLVDYCTEVGASVLVETVFMLPDPAHAHVSSSLVRQVASLGGDVAPYVPRAVAEFLEETRDG